MIILICSTNHIQNIPRLSLIPEAGFVDTLHLTNKMSERYLEGSVILVIYTLSLKTNIIKQMEKVPNIIHIPEPNENLFLH